MPKPNKEKLLEYARRSRLVSDSDLKAFLAKLKENTARPETPRDLADLMVEAKLINEWHAQNLLRGKYKGFTLGKYRLLGHLGTGGMSSVFLAEHPIMQRLVAVKVLPSNFVTDRNYLDRFKREARAVAALDHANIVRAYDIDQDGDRHYIVMEYVNGRDLQKVVKEDGRLDPVSAANYIAQAALGLQHAHDAGLIHRDIKPANCLLDKNGIVKLLDLGLAKFSNDEQSLSVLYDDTVVGTADYLAPEQAINSQLVDSRADIYGLGCTLYFLLVGQPPFPEGSIAQRLLKHQTTEPESILTLRPDVPPTLVDICSRMMMKSVDTRIQHASVVAEELTEWLHARDKVRGRATSPPGRSGDSSVVRESRFGRTSPPPLPPPVPNDDTVSSAGGNTMKVGHDSSVNDDLTLAPIDDEVLSGDSGRGSSVSINLDERGESADAREERHEDSGELDPASSSIDGVELGAYESGPLDDLLDEGSFKGSTELPKATFQARTDTGIPMSWIVAGIFAVVILGSLALLAIVGTFM